ncbi:MAG: iron-containing alcohol dehydrogenase [Flavobacteriales bacterium]|nr:iron-containing alcohol dehydrogenase [Flavobacteriales bacterium]
MDNFELYNPVNLIFGKGEISKISSNIPSGAKVLLTYGGGSIKKNGIYDQVVAALKGVEVIEFSGIEANPQYSTLMKAVELSRAENINFILAVGGGSVIDGSKFISVATPLSGDAWGILTGEAKIESAIPLGTVLTLPATGSEMNSGAVVSRKEINEKLPFGNPLCFPKFSILDPTVVASLPRRQLVNGVVDAFVHTLEQYVTYPNNAPLQDRIAESILITLLEIGEDVINNPSDYNLASNLMWSATMALNGLISKGVPSDWGTHMIGHELTALFNIDHGQTLAIIGPNLYRTLFDSKKEKLAQLGRRVFSLEGSDEKVGLEAIDKLQEFFTTLGMKTKISELTDKAETAPEIIFERFTKRIWLNIGEKGLITPKLAKEIVEMSI